MAGPWEKYPAQTSGHGGQLFTLPPDPAKAAAEARAEAAAQRAAAEWNASHNPDGSPRVQAPSLLGDPTKTGPAYLATLPPNIRGRVQQLLDGRSILTAREKGQPLGQQLMDAANQADPTFDENVSHARYVERTQYTGMGKGSQTVQAANRFARHLGDLYEASRALGGPDLGFAPLSNLATRASNSTQQSKVATYNTVLPLIQGEVQKLTKNGSATEGEGEHIMASLSVNQPATVRYAALKELARLGRAQVDPLHQSWESAWQGSTPPPIPMDIDPVANAVFDAVDSNSAPPKRDKRGEFTVAAVPPPANGPRPMGPEDKAKFFDILQTQGADKADEYLSQFGQRMQDKSQASRPYSKQLVPADKSYANSYLSQGLSGANEGLASVLGAPVDLATSAMNLVPKGFNAIANTDIPTISDPVAGGDWWKRRLADVGSILPQSSEAPKQFVRRVGQSVGAAAIPAAASGTVARTIAGLISGLGGGIGAATGQQLAPGNPLVEMGGEVAGSGLTGFGLVRAAQRAAQRGIEASVPTVSNLKDQAAQLYQRAETRGVTANPDQTNQLAATMQQALKDEGQLGPAGKITNSDTNTSKAFNLIQQYAGQEMKPTEMNTIRTVLSDSRQSPDPADRRLGNILLEHFDNWVSPLAPEFSQARSVASRYLQGQDLEQARELAGARASQFTGSGFENALRTEYRGLDRNNIKGNNYFNPDVTDAIQTVARGTPASNLLRGIGRLAPTGVVPGMGSLVPALGVASMASPAAGGAVGTTLAGAGVLGRIGATRMGINAANNAELIARNGGALPQAELLPQGIRDMMAWLAAGQAAKYQSGNQ